MIHQNENPLAGKSVKIKEQSLEIGGEEIVIEDWWDRVSGRSWMVSDGNPACLSYAMRSGFGNIPTDNEVLYGKIGCLGYLVHASEIEEAN